ncbi:MAG: HAD hydrolase family protein [Candidatus Poseidoniales archaeon]
MAEQRYLICFDMDRVLVDHLSTWQFVYDKLGINNDDSFALYNQGKLDEWDWIKLDLALIKSARNPPPTDSELREMMADMPLMKNWEQAISKILKQNAHVAIISGGLQHTARYIAAQFPSNNKWKKRWGGIDPNTAKEQCNGYDSVFHVFTNGWLLENDEYAHDALGDFGRYQVQMNGKGSIVNMLQRRLGIPKANTASVGDSAGDIGMFEQSDLSICFNPWNEEPIAVANHTIHERDLMLVYEHIKTTFDWR